MFDILRTTIVTLEQEVRDWILLSIGKYFTHIKNCHHWFRRICVVNCIWQEIKGGDYHFRMDFSQVFAPLVRDGLQDPGSSELWKLKLIVI